MNGQKNTMAAANSQPSEFLEDNVLMQGLKSFGITIEQLLEANLVNMEPNAYAPIKKKYKNMDEFVEKVQSHL